MVSDLISFVWKFYRRSLGVEDHSYGNILAEENLHPTWTRWRTLLILWSFSFQSRFQSNIFWHWEDERVNESNYFSRQYKIQRDTSPDVPFLDSLRRVVSDLWLRETGCWTLLKSRRLLVYTLWPSPRKGSTRYSIDLGVDRETDVEHSPILRLRGRFGVDLRTECL